MISKSRLFGAHLHAESLEVETREHKEREYEERQRQSHSIQSLAPRVANATSSLSQPACCATTRRDDGDSWQQRSSTHSICDAISV